MSITAMPSPATAAKESPPTAYRFTRLLNFSTPRLVIDTEQARAELINSRLAYVAVSRGRFDAQIYTNDAGKLGQELRLNVSKQSALETGHEMGGRDQDRASGDPAPQSIEQSHERGHWYGIEH